MPRYAILTHDHPFLHWDFLLENGSTCRTWRLMNCPDHPEPIPAKALPDHRLMYLDYEGPVSGDRGTVSPWDAGTFDWLKDEPERVVVRVNGQKLKGTVQLVRNDDGAWLWSASDE